MTRLFLSLLSIIGLMITVITPASADVVVFVHGLGGFGPDELFGLGYWGFSKIFIGQDYLKAVRDRGHQVYYASVGPVSSNWDRACELYAQIKGTRVDYGQAHSTKYGHARYGKDYSGKGLVPNWDGSRRIHFVGHSMGGNTIRVLEYLLQKGAPEEVSASGSGTSLLFQTSKPGGNTWMQSVFTIATPHDGSTLHTKLGAGFVGFIKNLIGTFAGVAGLLPNSPDWGYNLDLDQFGLVRKSGEGFWTYFNRVFASSIFQPSFKDLASWDLSPQWSREFNAKTDLAFPNTYYFSASTRQTAGCFWYDQCATISSEFLMAITANQIGDLDGVCDSGGYCFDNSWEPSDGLVPTRSSSSPQVGIRNFVNPVSWNSATSYPKGKWHTREYKRDHIQIIGFRLNPLVFNAADGLYDLIGQTIDRIRVPIASTSDGSFDESSGAPSEVNNDGGIIAGSILGGISAIVLLGVAVVQVRRRRHSKRMVTAFTSKPEPSQFSPRKFNKKQIERGSVTLHSMAEVDNPAFAPRGASTEDYHDMIIAREASIAAPTRIDV